MAAPRWIVALLLLIPGLAHAANIELQWAGSSNGAVQGLGTAVVEGVVPGDTLTLDIYFHLEAGESVYITTSSLTFDHAGSGDELDLISFVRHDHVQPSYPCSPFPTCLTAFQGPALVHHFLFGSSTLESTPTQAGLLKATTLGTLAAVVPPGPQGPLSIRIGTVRLLVKSNVEGPAAEIVFFPGFDASYDNNLQALTVTGSSASINPVPEPSTAALLALGIAALGAQRRHRNPR